MKQKWKRRCRGAISIFLIIIFLAQYILCGLLVDSARHRMASAMAESALDSASESVLSYYNELLMDLYGLMATDGLSKKDIQDKLNSYVERTLGVAELDNTSALKTITELVGAALGGADDPAGFDGYDFQVTVDAKATTSLANTDFVEYQLIEHMKYRAPVLLLTDTDSLFGRLKDLVDIKDRLTLVQSKMNVQKEAKQKDNAAAAGQTLKDINTFITLTECYVQEPADTDIDEIIKKPPSIDDVYTGTPKDLSDYVTPIDEAVQKAAEEYLEEWKDYREDYKDYEEACENAGEDDPTPTPPTEPDWSKEDWEKKVQKGVTEAQKSFEKLRKNAQKVRNRATTLLQEMDDEIKSYTAYIEKLESARKNASGSAENIQTVFAPEIELAEANAGQLLKNRPFLTYVQEFAGELAKSSHMIDANNNISKIVGRHGTALVPMVEELMNSMESVEGLEGDDSLPDRLCTTALEVMAMPGVIDFSWIDHNLKYLADTRKQDAIKNVRAAEVNVSVNEGKAEEEIEKATTVDQKNLRDLSETDLSITYEKSPKESEEGKDKEKDEGGADSFDMGGKINTDDGEGMLNAAGGVLDKLMGLLEDLRDSVYVNQYVVYYFPNYVDNYRNVKKLKDDDNAKKFEDGDYKDYCATQAEVEYVLTGKADTKASVLEVKAKLLGIRTAFNMIAVFTDSAKVAQANAIGAVAGPFAPFAAIALLIGWAVAESTLDVIDLCNGEEVPLFKQGADWKLSAGGLGKAVVTGIASSLVEYGTGFIEDKVNGMVSQVASTADKAIYAAYNAANSSCQQGVAAAKNTMNEWSGALKSNLSGLGSEAAAVGNALDSAVGQINSAMDENVAKVGNFTLKVKDQAVQKVAQASKKVEDVTHEKLSVLGDKLTNRVAEAVGGWIDRNATPLGDVVSDKGAHSKTPGLTYMDYMQIFLLLENQDKKVQRIQSLIQANIRYKEPGGDTETSGKFSMAESYGAVEATLNGSIKFLFMSEPIIPASMRQDGRLKLSAHSAVSY